MELQYAWVTGRKRSKLFMGTGLKDSHLALIVALLSLVAHLWVFWNGTENKSNILMVIKQYLRQYPSLYVCPLMQNGLGSEILIEFLSVANTVPLTLRLKLPFSTAASIRLPIFLATFVPSSPIITWPSLVSFAAMPSRSTVTVKQKKNHYPSETLNWNLYKLNDKFESEANLEHSAINLPTISRVIVVLGIDRRLILWPFAFSGKQRYKDKKQSGHWHYRIFDLALC